MYDSQLYPVSSTSRLELHSSLYLTLPHVKEILLNQPSDSTDQERRIWIRNRIQDNRQDIISDILTLQTKIKKDLARKVLLKDGKSVALVDDWDDAQLHEQLDRPEVYFRCTNCQPDTTYPFSDVVTHACASNDKGEKAFRNRYSGIPDSMCIPTEWQPDRIEVADGFKGVHDALQSIARTQHTGKFTGAAAARNPFKFPSSQTTVSTDHRWTFQCKLEACPMQSYMRLHNFVSEQLSEKKRLQSLCSQSYLAADSPHRQTYSRRKNDSETAVR